MQGSGRYAIPVSERWVPKAYRLDINLAPLSQQTVLKSSEGMGANNGTSKKAQGSRRFRHGYPERA